MEKKLLLLSILFTLTLFPLAFADYSLVANGGFETGDNTDWNGVLSTNIYSNPRTITNGSADYNFLGEDNFIYSFNQNNFGSYNFPAVDKKFCMNNAIIEPYQEIDFNFIVDFAFTTSGVSNTITESYSVPARLEKTLIYLTNTPNDFSLNGAGNYNVPEGKYAVFDNDIASYKTGTLTNDNNYSYICFAVGEVDRTTSGSYGNIITSYYMFDNLEIKVNPGVLFDVEESDDPVDILEPFSISATAYNWDTYEQLDDSDVTLTINFNGAGYEAMSYSGGTWTYNNTGEGQGNYDYTIKAVGDDFAESTADGSIEVALNYETNLIVTNIDNAPYQVTSENVIITPQTSADVIFSVLNENDLPVSADVNFFIVDSDDLDKQYWIYTSTTGTGWTLNETLTFGSTNSNGLNKLWDSTRHKYVYSYTNNIQPNQTKYYKLVFDEVPKYWETIGASFDWINVNPSQVVSEDDGRHNYDLFQNSSVTQINSYTREEYPDLTSSDFDTGFYLQFSAYAEKEIPLEVGYRIGSTDTTETVNLTTSWATYTVLIDSSDNNAQLLIKSDSSISSRVYLSDYRIVPASYFNSKLNILDTGVLVRNGVSNEILREVLPFGVTTSFYDREEDLSKLYLQVLLDSNVIKTYEYNLNQDSLNVSKTTYINEDLDGVIDYSGQGNSGLTLIPLKDITVKAILVNSADENVSEQHKTIKFLQYPYFQDDLSITVNPISKKVGDAPKFDLRILQKEPDALIGFDVYISTSQSIDDALHKTTIYKEELNCASLIACNKTITIDDFAYPSEDNYFIIVEALLTTEAQLHSNVLTKTTVSLSVSYYDFETARLLQLLERSDAEYNNTEQIPLVFQARTDSLENLQSDYIVYLGIDTNSNGDYTTVDLNFSPQKFIYDDVTGYNYWFWNGIFYDSDGDLIPDGNAIRLRAYVSPVSQKTAVPRAYGLVNKCASYNANFDFGTLLMNWIGYDVDVGGCDVLSDTVVYYDDADSTEILINNSYTPSALQNHSLFCHRTDQDLTYKAELGDSFICAVFYLKDEEQIDGFKVYLGNDYSDYALTGDEAQYISFDVDQTEVLFNDIELLRRSLEISQDNEINTYSELIQAGLNELLPYGQPIVDFAQNFIIINAGADLNIEQQVNPTLVNGAIWFKVDNLSVINKYNYIENYPELEELPTQYFRRFMNDKKVFLPIKDAKITLYSRGTAPFQTFKIKSPLIIDEAPKQNTSTINTDANTSTGVVPSSLKFNFIVDMFSANRTRGTRAFVPIYFTYIVSNPLTINSIIDIFTGAIEDPAKFFSDNWFFIVVLIIFILIGSLVYANFKGGGIVINNAPPYNRGG